jgi:hypothetical protein
MQKNKAMNVAIFRDVEPCSPYMNHHFGVKYNFHLQGRKSAEQETSLQQVASRTGYTALYPAGWQHS